MRHIHGRAVDCASNCCTLGLAIEKNGKHNKLQIQEIQVSRIDGVRCFDATMEELRVSLEELKEALAEDKPAAYDADEVVAARMLEQDAAVQQ
jgi:hypothetical protein